MQGARCDRLEVGPIGVVGDRRLAVVDEETGHLISAKQIGELLQADTAGDQFVLPDGRGTFAFDDPAAAEALSSWLGRRVRVASPEPDTQSAYEMTFDPPDDDAELFTIPTPPGSFVDLAHVHLVTTATLDGCRAARPELDWDVRRFRPNLVLDVDGPTFVEDGWRERTVRIGDHVVLEIMMPTVRCAMPLRAQPGLERQRELFAAMRELNTEMPNHLGVYATVKTTGAVAVGDEVTLD
jgi:uncharacterized protein YcbX